jgi:taurine---2-oxoglutarate transaminase
MAVETASTMSSEEIVRLSREHTFFSWSAQGAIDPIAIDRAEGA